MSELSFVAFWLTFGPIITLLTLIPLVELKTLYYGFPTYTLFGVPVVLPKVVILQARTRWASEGITFSRPSFSTTSPISKAQAKEIVAAAAILLLRAEGPTEMKDHFKLVASGFKYGRSRANKRWYSIASRSGLLAESRVAVYRSNLTGLMWAGYKENNKTVLVDTINWN